MSENRLAEVSEYRQRREALKGNKTVKRPLARIDKSLGKKSATKRKKLSPKQMITQINKYFEHCENEDVVPSIKGMMIFMKLYQSSFYKYIQSPEYTDLLEHARMIISEWAETDVYNTSGQAAGKIAYMKNIHGWSDKLETQNTSEVRHVASVEEARQKIEALAPQLLELLKSQMTVNQIAHAEDAEYEESK